MATSVIINDFVLRRRASLLFNETNFQTVVNAWDKEDQMLLDLQSVSLFTGLTKWNQLDPLHFRLLITNTFNNRDKAIADMAKHFDDTEPLVATLYFLIMALVYCIQRRAHGAVDTLKIMRVSELDVTLEFTLTMMPEEKKKKPAPVKPGLQVIVDNTDK